MKVALLAATRVDMMESSLVVEMVVAMDVEMVGEMGVP